MWQRLPFCNYRTFILFFGRRASFRLITSIFICTERFILLFLFLLLFSVSFIFFMRCNKLGLYS